MRENVYFIIKRTQILEEYNFKFFEKLKNVCD